MTVSSDAAGGVHEFAGEVRARTESRLSFRVGGKLLRRNVDAGSAVKAGQVLAQLDPRDLRLGQDAARAALVAAQANYNQTLADFRRYKDLRDQGFISSADLERRDTALKAAKAQLDQAQAQASVQGNQAAYASLVADASGVITGVEAEPGMVVAAGAPVLHPEQADQKEGRRTLRLQPAGESEGDADDDQGADHHTDLTRAEVVEEELEEHLA